MEKEAELNLAVERAGIFVDEMAQAVEADPVQLQYWAREKVRTQALRQWLRDHCRQIAIIEKEQHPLLSI